MLDQNINKISYFIFSLIPFSIIAGPTVSLINILILNLSFLIFLIFQKNFEFIKHISIKLMLILLKIWDLKKLFMPKLWETKLLSKHQKILKTIQLRFPFQKIRFSKYCFAVDSLKLI